MFIPLLGRAIAAICCIQLLELLCVVMVLQLLQYAAIAIQLYSCSYIQLRL